MLLLNQTIGKTGSIGFYKYGYTHAVKLEYTYNKGFETVTKLYPLIFSPSLDRKLKNLFDEQMHIW